MKLSTAICLFLAPLGKVVALDSQEQGSYINPSEALYHRCDDEDRIALSSCRETLLRKLDTCKPDDLACECCALQSLQAECFELCVGAPSTAFMNVMFEDCEALGDINACSLPFKKTDYEQAKISKEKFGKKPGDEGPEHMKVNYKIKSVPGQTDTIVKSKLDVEVAVPVEKKNATAHETKNVSQAKNVTKVDMDEESSAPKTQVWFLFLILPASFYLLL